MSKHHETAGMLLMDFGIPQIQANDIKQLTKLMAQVKRKLVYLCTSMNLLLHKIHHFCDPNELSWLYMKYRGKQMNRHLEAGQRGGKHTHSFLYTIEMKNTKMVLQYDSIFFNLGFLCCFTDLN